ncbi:ubiquinone/menaquinone biosynthesis C-methylase UbiE [Pararhizobium capsulatum DSM 1112]|uniref:Ubiquinone/menaquinone biosynthesis C-methylase UbiE n=1 Tax=Pararhizobium capsulatum DSM 1112 TaxID=1121113 RepID=A0ABU0BPM9_9HYPH|nr:class I SAM-dependent methyltransferase [Pararhizobium capsulatum]MDQ0320204.1 ubiquinone/menaquinone biosynthesis C-methylase UbiE [Pararhizobium capsulatum DSM 1112]
MTPKLDAIYADHVLTSLYDVLNPAGVDTDFYLSLPNPNSTILDVGCGTGLLTAAFAAGEHSVVGLDPAPAMLEIARKRQGGREVAWIEADARDFELGRSFDLVVMTGHVFQVFLSHADVSKVLSSIRRHLKPGGRLVFDSRNPLARAWERWTPEYSRRAVDHPVLGRVETWHEIENVTPTSVSFSSFTSISDRPNPLVSRSELAFRTQAEIEALLKDCGFASRQWLGSWDCSPFEAGSPEIIVIAA